MRRIKVEVLSLRGFRSTANKIRSVGERLADALEPLRARTSDVRVVVRCAACGTVVARHHLFLFEDAQGRQRCKRHGPLIDSTMRELHEEWSRRGRPETLNIKRHPVSSIA